MIFTAFKHLPEFEKTIFEQLFELQEIQVKKTGQLFKIPKAKSVEQLFELQRLKKCYPVTHFSKFQLHYEAKLCILCIVSGIRNRP